ncbi:MAG: FMN-binding protein [Spirochaetaceae bacterium]|jgi:major membrane immunogen (membrane-anchored lipoprotein)|nr:FMN-binding protein [Spirochaetaceae bacterium]
MKMRYLFLVTVFLPLTGCTPGTSSMKDGYYTAESSSFDHHGWKEFVTIRVSNGRIVMVEYNAKNLSGFMKSWDMEYTRLMKETTGTYPNEYTRIYAMALLNSQDVADIDALAGATASYQAFVLLARKAVEKAQAGDTAAAFVNLSY